MSLQYSTLTQFDIFVRRYSLPLISGIFAGLFHANIDRLSYSYLFATYNDIQQASNIEYLILIPNYKLFNKYNITLLFLINECFMVFFFAFVVKQIIQSLAPPNGNMYPPKKAITPIISSLFGIITPISFYILFVFIFNIWWSPLHPIKTILNGWAIPMSTDIALSWTVATFIFNNTSTSHPCISFLLLSSIFDSLIGLLVITIFYPKQHFILQPQYLLLILAAVIISIIANKCFHIRRWWVYIFILGSMSWTGFLLTCIHPALALVPIIPCMLIKNTKKRNSNSQRVIYKYIGAQNDESEFEFDASDSAESADIDIYDSDVIISSDDNLSVISEQNSYEPYSLKMLDNFESFIQHFVQYGLFFFTYANSGVYFTDFGNMTLLVFLSVLFGKVIGITFGAWFSNIFFQIPLPQNMKLKQLPLIGFCASLSLTISLFISNIAFIENQLTNQAKMGALCAAALGVFGGILYKIIYKLNRFYDDDEEDKILRHDL